MCGRVPEHPVGATDCHCGALLGAGTKLAEIAKSWPQVRYEGEGGRAEGSAHRVRDGRFTQGEYPPNCSAAHSVDIHPPFSPPNGCPVSRVDELVKEAAMMIKCENESGKLDEVR